MKTEWRKFSVALAVGLVGVGLAALWRPVQAQIDGWTAPQLIFEGRGAINAPALVADHYGQVHAFWMFEQDQQTDKPQQQIYYTRLDQPTWPVNDIFIGPVTSLNIKVIATSEIKISVLIDRKYMELAVQALHDAFDLDKAS